MLTITSFRGSNKFLSNMYPALVDIDGELYPSAEHAFQAMKSLNKDDRIAIAVCRSAEEAKKAGRSVDLRKDWEDAKLDIMYSIVKAKFSNPALAHLLEQTGDAILIEGNTWGDTFWGVCDGEGDNNLGKILMRIREELK